ncbi:cell wall-active antibiotics response protein LiaF [Robertmurraya massiliosenegalensis]|uniref:cell wall-active antibiotics response protein LiaF n=1 Tax=Robertmurraya massiliosenegalensis TaxID=1287657 RepID=UPI0002DA324C|nr:cell wall-active antibiotics response protein LiaF [Robertmurraya massiliosenegalensis]
MKYKSINQTLFALFLLALGVVLLLINIGVISMEIKEIFVVFYPFFLFIIGLSMLLKNLLRRGRKKFTFSTLLLLFSSLLILDRFEVITFAFKDVWKLWPVLLILVSLSLLFKKSILKIGIDLSSKDKEFKKDSGIEFIKTRKTNSLIGSISYKESNWSLEPIELSNSIGDYFIDFSKAFIPDRETPIIINGWIGDVKMIIPENIPVNIKVDCFIGDIRIFDIKDDSINRGMNYKSHDYDEAIKKLKIVIEVQIGSIRIDKV